MILKKKAFTLIEILIVLVLVWVVSTITFLDFWTQSPKARNATRLDTSAKVRLAYQIANIEEKVNFKDCNSVWASLVVYSWRTSQGCNIKINSSSSWQLFLKSLNITNTIQDPNSPDFDYDFTYLKNSSKYEFSYQKENENPVISYNPLSTYALTYDESQGRILIVDWNYVWNTMSWFYIITPIKVPDATKYPLTLNPVTTDSWTNITTILPSDSSSTWSYAYYLRSILHNSEETTNSRLALIKQLWFPISISDLVDNSNNCLNWNWLVFSGWIWQCWAWSSVNRSSYIDSDDINYYVDPNGTSVMSWATIKNANITTLTLWNWSIFNTSTWSNVIDWTTSVNWSLYMNWSPNYLSWTLYDSNDPSYYLDPNWTSKLNHLTLWNWSIVNSSTGSNSLSWSTYLNWSLYVNGTLFDPNNNTGTLNLNHLNLWNWSILNSSTWSNFLVWPTYLMWWNNYLSWALYDWNNTSYYIDPNWTSIMSWATFSNLTVTKTLTVWNWTVINNSTDWSNTFSGTVNLNWITYLNWLSNYLNGPLYSEWNVWYYLYPSGASILNNLYIWNWSVLNNSSNWSNTLAWTTNINWSLYMNWSTNYLSWALIDTNNNSYYLDPNLTSVFNQLNFWNGSIVNSSTGSNFWNWLSTFYWSVYLNWSTNYLSWSLIDSNDNSYYLDPNLTSNLNLVNWNKFTAWNWSILNSSTWSNFLYWPTYLMWWNNYLSWALYDWNNTSYYLDPNLTSNINNVTRQWNAAVVWTTQMTWMVWINTAPSTYNLSVNGTSNFTGGLTTINWSWALKYNDSHQQNWYVLTSDTNWVAKWNYGWNKFLCSIASDPTSCVWIILSVSWSTVYYSVFGSNSVFQQSPITTYTLWSSSCISWYTQYTSNHNSFHIVHYATNYVSSWDLWGLLNGIFWIAVWTNWCLAWIPQISSSAQVVYPVTYSSSSWSMWSTDGSVTTWNNYYYMPYQQYYVSTF